MVEDVSYLIKPRYKIDLNGPASNGQWPWSEMANHPSRTKTSTDHLFQFTILNSIFASF